jgi:hypothetical protein
LAPLFSKPVCHHGHVLLLGAILSPGKRTVTQAWRVVRFPYRRVGYVLLGGAVLIWIAAGVTNKAGLFQLGVQCALGGLGCLAIARRTDAPDASAVLAVDPRPPVLYLRPFQQAEETFAELPWRWQDFWTTAGRSIMRRKSWRLLTLEQYLGLEVPARIGCLVVYPYLADNSAGPKTR